MSAMGNLHTLQPLIQGTGFVNPGGFVIRLLDYFEQNSYLKILIGCLWGKG